ncbi:unnamed protein product [Musa banksii]
MHLSNVLPSLQSYHGSLSHMMPIFPKLCTARPRNHIVPRASNDVPLSYRYPPMTKKPEWWWRTLACIPYLMPLHETWMYAGTAYHLHSWRTLSSLLTPSLDSFGACRAGSLWPTSLLLT